MSRFFARAIKLPGERAVQNVVDQRGFARAGNARHHRHHAQRKSDVEILQVVFARAQNRDARCRWHGGVRAASRSAAAAGDVGAGQRIGSFHDLVRRALRDQLAAVTPRARAEVDHVVGAADGLFVVLDHQHRVAEIAQLFEREQQTVVVAMVQSDGRLVEHVQHAAQLRSDLRRQPDALAFAAGECGGRAIERNVAQPDGIQKLKALDDLVHDRGRRSASSRPVELDLFARLRMRAIPAGQ